MKKSEIHAISFSTETSTRDKRIVRSLKRGEGGETFETRRIFSNARIKDTCEQLATFRATLAFPRDLPVKITRGIL